MELNYIDVGRRIRNERKLQKLTQEKLAEQIGISVTHMSHIETADTKLSLSVLVQLANALNVSTDFLLCGNIALSKQIYQNSIADILNACDENQIRIIADMIKALKESLDNRN